MTWLSRFILFGLGTLFVAQTLISFVSGQDNRQLVQEKIVVPQTTDNRTALVIGNAAYLSSPLTNPANDATDIAVTLKDLNFEVISGVNQSRSDMIRLVRQFGERLKIRGGVGVFYYAGHGLQVEGRNYLVPVDARIRSENEVELEAIDISRVLVEMENAENSLNIVILDACRNNPFGRSWRSANEGLAQINAPTGTLIAYSTAPGKVASDGSGRNAPYTAALLIALKISGLGLSDVFMQVRAQVLQITKKQQTPWEASSVIGRFYFKKGENALATIESQPTLNQVEREFWDSVKTSQNTNDFHVYLKEYPNGLFTSLARLRIEQLQQKSGSPTSTASLQTPNKGVVFRPTQEQIISAQNLLREKAIYSEKVTGIYNDPTREGIKRFQKDNGLKETGTLNRATIEAMGIILTNEQKLIPVSASSYATTTTAPFRATPDQIKAAQKILKDGKMYSSDATGKLDDSTRDGLKKYQGANSLSVTGTLNPATLDKMGIALTDKQKTDSMPK